MMYADYLLDPLQGLPGLCEVGPGVLHHDVGWRHALLLLPPPLPPLPPLPPDPEALDDLLQAGDCQGAKQDLKTVHLYTVHSTPVHST